ncbi:magnesium protoporphyrin IX methyltransferase [Phaeovibrio sulfidiphilus]|uniref:Magnesium protoporphyrin IX methyltransferase n=1 Tax=Phaeovibrio sulfidiphilus TaxID=1220600 RepID=A0A8J7CPT6_9PROT|nr:magnesium protoporphyrin IX methyltransferase [Phaeovibrio sulfidiphilus]MBE1236060.1 magnesium protoporphyrin IX methyltransferase [Phaeovibrio sulfidiphilus]
MHDPAYEQRRGEVEHYFDRQAAHKWAQMTSNSPLNRIRQTVREGRDRMRSTLLSWLPADLAGQSLFDAGCGPAMLSIEAARRGADVVGVDLSRTLIDVGVERATGEVLKGSLELKVGDAFAPVYGDFDHIVAMDCLIHYDLNDTVRVLANWAPHVRGSIVFTYAPRTPLLATMHVIGKLFPKSDRSPRIIPLAEERFHEAIRNEPGLKGWKIGRTARVVKGFYISQALELLPK